MNPMILMALFVLLLAGLIVLGIITRYLSLWFQALVSGTPVSLVDIIAMSLRKIPSRDVVSAYISARKAGINITISDLQVHYLAGGRIANVVQALIAASKAAINLDWKNAAAIDLAGRDVLEAVKTSVNPKVIDCPTSGYVVGVAKDGIEIKVRARVTVRTNISQLVGGATEETVIARVGQGIISTVGDAETYNEVLASPGNISDTVFKKGVAEQTAFEVVSIDIAAVEVGANKGAELRESNALANMKVSQADAEGRRAKAVALEQENKAELVKAEASVPLALSEALKSGNLGVMDYYKMQNIQADTHMREGIGNKKVDKKGQKEQ